MTIGVIIKRAGAELADAGISESGNDAVKLCEHVFGISREQLYAHPEFEPDEKDVQKFFELVERRKKREPLAYVTGFAFFYGHKFKVTPDVLIPRWDTEIIVSVAQELISEFEEKTKGRAEVLDLCCGSGCVGVSLAAQTKALVTCSDISTPAVAIAKENAGRIIKDEKTRIRFAVSDLFQKITGKFDFIVSNPPYVKKDEIRTLMPEVAEFEPFGALCGGDDGLKFYRLIAAQAPDFLNPGGRLLLEIGCDQARDVSRLLRESGFKSIKITKDLAGRDRVITAGYRRVTEEEENV